jgi:hypothetical protein
MKAINNPKFSVSIIIIVLAVLYMCFNGFSIALSVVTASVAVYAILVLFVIIADYTNREPLISDYPIGKRALVVGNVGRAKHHLDTYSSYLIIGHYDEDTLVVQWGHGRQMINLCDVTQC